MAGGFICEECPRTLECIVCASLFRDTRTGRGRFPRFCSPACKVKRLRALGVQYRIDGRRAGYGAEYYLRKPTRTAVCRGCGQSFQTKQRVVTYCSKRCVTDAAKARYPDAYRQCATCTARFKPARINRRQKQAGYVQLHCSYRCAGIDRDQPEPTNRRTRKASLKTNARWVAIDPFKVFARDKWRCHLCGCLTLKRLRGTTDDSRARTRPHSSNLSRWLSHL